jgi:hypothetical protein
MSIFLPTAGSIRGGRMTVLKMHWQLIQGADGRPHLNIQWESEQPDFVRDFARTQIHRSARRK